MTTAPNTHVAYVLTDYYDNDAGDHIVFDEPKRKMIASGDEKFCQGAIDRYMIKYPTTKADRLGILERERDARGEIKTGNPFQSEWSSVPQ